jgi:insulysin
LDELEGMAVKLFSHVKNKKLTAPSWTEHPFGLEQLQMKGYIVPVKDVRNLNITFPIPDLHEYYKAGVSQYECFLMT